MKADRNNALPSVTPHSEQRDAWSAVFSMSLCVALLIASEFMPVSLLTPIADGLKTTAGHAGQAISISGFFAIIASLLMTTVAGQVNRKSVLLCMTALMWLSLALIASAPSYFVLMLARAVLGICIGGFWALGTAVIMRLVSRQHVSRALTIMFTGQAIAAAFAAPLGGYLGEIMGWRGVFWILVPIVTVNFIWQMYALPSMPSKEKQSFSDMFSLLKRVYFLRAIAAVLFVFSGAFAMFTYLRPFLELVTHVDVITLSQLLLVVGIAGFAGTWLGGKFADSHTIRLLQSVPFVMAIVTLGLLGFGQLLVVTAVLLAIWGAMNTAMSISWMAWLSQNVDDAPEAAGSIFVATVQAAILIGAALGGALLDQVSINATFIASIALSALAFMIIGDGKKLLKPAPI